MIELLRRYFGIEPRDDGRKMTEKVTGIYEYFGMITTVSVYARIWLVMSLAELGKARAAIADFDSPDFNKTVHEWERSEYFEFL